MPEEREEGVPSTKETDVSPFLVPFTLLLEGCPELHCTVLMTRRHYELPLQSIAFHGLGRLIDGMINYFSMNLVRLRHVMARRGSQMM